MLRVRSWQASMPRPSFRKAKALLGQPERSFKEGSTTGGCKHGTLQACQELQTQEEAVVPEGSSTRRQ